MRIRDLHLLVNFIIKAAIFGIKVPFWVIDDALFCIFSSILIFCCPFLLLFLHLWKDFDG